MLNDGGDSRPSSRWHHQGYETLHGTARSTACSINGDVYDFEEFGVSRSIRPRPDLVGSGGSRPTCRSRRGGRSRATWCPRGWHCPASTMVTGRRYVAHASMRTACSSCCSAYGSSTLGVVVVPCGRARGRASVPTGVSGRGWAACRAPRKLLVGGDAVADGQGSRQRDPSAARAGGGGWAARSSARPPLRCLAMRRADRSAGHRDFRLARSPRIATVRGRVPVGGDRCGVQRAQVVGGMASVSTCTTFGRSLRVVPLEYCAGQAPEATAHRRSWPASGTAC